MIKTRNLLITNLLGARGQFNAGAIGVKVVGDDSCKIAGCTGERTTITELLLDVAHNGTFRHIRQRNNVANCKICLLATIDKLASVGSLCRNESLLFQAEAVGVTEDDSGEGSATPRVVNNWKKNWSEDVKTILVRAEERGHILTLKNGY